MNIFKKELKKIKENIILRKQALLAFHSKKKNLILELNDIKSKLIEEISDKKDDKGKALYSNQSKRDTALKYALLENENFVKKSNLLETIEIEIKDLEIELDSFKMDFKIEEIISRY